MSPVMTPSLSSRTFLPRDGESRPASIATPRITSIGAVCRSTAARGQTVASLRLSAEPKPVQCGIIRAAMRARTDSIPPVANQPLTTADLQALLRIALPPLTLTLRERYLKGCPSPKPHPNQWTTADALATD
jgi:hypothetical protein